MRSVQKVVVITGASRGIGAELVRAYHGLGYAIIANARTIQAENFPGMSAVFPVAGDIAAPDTAGRIVAAAMERFGRIDTLINNAGVFIPKPFVDYTESDFQAMMGANMAGFFRLTQKVAARMLDANSGHIVTITAALAGQPMAVLPAALASLTKGGLDAVTRALAIEYAGGGIRVNAVAPGVIDTPMHRPEMHEFLAGLQPMARMGKVGHVADAVLYLEQAKFVTGEILHVDGGAHAGRW